MDIRFLKGLTPNVGYLFPKHGPTSSTPALDIISVGIGQIVKNHAIFVPIYGFNSPYLIKKVVCQNGGSVSNSLSQNTGSVQTGGSNEAEVADETIQSSDKSTSSASSDKFNEAANEPTPVNLIDTSETASETLSRKRKLDEAIKASFQHPVIKTKTLLLSTKANTKATNDQFKFRVID